MKKFLAVILSISLVLALVGCGGIGAGKAGNFKLGLGIVGTVGGADGDATYDATVAAVVLDDAGKIADCVIDAIQNKVEIENGVIDDDAAEEDFETKNEDGNDYGMKKYSGIGKEWFEQAEFFADYIKGMTSDEVSAIAVKDGKPTEQLILSGCTIGVSDFIKAVVAACNDKYAKSFSGSDVKLGLGIASSFDASSKNAGAEEGSVKLESNICASATDKSGKVLALALDTVTPEIKFDSTGKVTNAGAEVASKKQAGDNYGMKKYSGIGKEWYEQVAAFEDYAVGLDATGINSIAVGNDGKTTDDMLKAGCTIAVSGLVRAAYKSTK